MIENRRAFLWWFTPLWTMAWLSIPVSLFTQGTVESQFCRRIFRWIGSNEVIYLEVRSDNTYRMACRGSFRVATICDIGSWTYTPDGFWLLKTSSRLIQTPVFTITFNNERQRLRLHHFESALQKMLTDFPARNAFSRRAVDELLVDTPPDESEAFEISYGDKNTATIHRASIEELLVHINDHLLCTSQYGTKCRPIAHGCVSFLHIAEGGRLMFPTDADEVIEEIKRKGCAASGSAYVEISPEQYDAEVEVLWEDCMTVR